jgi:hypothetical protein
MPTPVVTVDGLVDGYYLYNFTNGAKKVPGSGSGGAYFYSPIDDSFSLGLAEANFTATQGQASAHLKLVDVTNGGVGGLKTPGIDVLQGYISYNPGQWTFNVGRFVTWMGNEVIESNSNWNYTRSLNFQYAIPYWHEGLSVNYTPSSMFNITGYVVGGWNNAGNAAFYDWGKTYGFEATIAPDAAWNIVINGIAGPGETAGNDYGGDARYDAEGIITWKPTSDWSFALDGVYGAQDTDKAGVTLTSADTTLTKTVNSLPFWMVDLYARYQIQSDWALALRLEEAKDTYNLLGIYGATAAPNALDIEAREATLTVEHNFTANTLMRLEGRYDDALSGGSELKDKTGPFAAGSPSEVTALASAVFIY